MSNGRPCALCTARRQSFLMRGNLLHEECARVLLEAEDKAWRILGIVLATPFVALILAFFIMHYTVNARQEQYNAKATKLIRAENQRAIAAQIKPKRVVSAEEERQIQKLFKRLETESRTRKY